MRSKIPWGTNQGLLAEEVPKDRKRGQLAGAGKGGGLSASRCLIDGRAKYAIQKR